MTTWYQDYQKQIAELQAKAQEVRNVEFAHAKTQIHALMKVYGLALADIGDSAKRPPKVPRKPVDIKYKDEVTGDTWTGRVRAPSGLRARIGASI